MSYQKFPVGVGGGVNFDLPPRELDAQTFSAIHNLRMKNKRLIPVQGYADVFDPIPQPPEHVLGIVKQEVPTIFIAGNGQLHKNANGLWSNVTRASGGDYLTDLPWQSTILNNCVFMNNGTDTLQVLEAGDAVFKDSVNIPASFTAKVFRGFKNYLFALNVNEGVTQIPTALRWSDPADPGTEPPSWDVADPTTQAGQLALADTDGAIVDAQQLRDQLMIYKTDSVYSCQWIGGIYVFSFQKVISNKGLLSKGCVSTFENSHFCVGYDDIYVHDGLQARSISEGRVRNYFFKDLNQDYLDNVFTVPHLEEKEVWICYPDDQATDGACNKALVWNWTDNVWTTRDLPNVADTSLAIIDPKLDDLWDAGVPDTWDLGDLHWDANNFSRANLSMLMASKVDDKLYQINDSGLFGTETFDYSLEKLSHAYGQEDVVKHLNHLTPDIAGQGLIHVRFGTQNNLGEGVRWGRITDYTLGKFRMYTRGQGRYFSMKLYGDTSESIPSIGAMDSYMTIEGEK
jgi:hypothetical protein